MKKAFSGKTTPTDKTDWARVRAMTDADIQFDEDSPKTTPADWEGAAIKKNGIVIGRVRGPGKKPARVQTTIRFEADVLAGLRATGKGWQTRVNDAMREWLKTHPVA